MSTNLLNSPISGAYTAKTFTFGILTYFFPLICSILVYFRRFQWFFLMCSYFSISPFLLSDMLSHCLCLSIFINTKWLRLRIFIYVKSSASYSAVRRTAVGPSNKLSQFLQKFANTMLINIINKNCIHGSMTNISNIQNQSFFFLGCADKS